MTRFPPAIAAAAAVSVVVGAAAADPAIPTRMAAGKVLSLFPRLGRGLAPVRARRTQPNIPRRERRLHSIRLSETGEHLPADRKGAAARRRARDPRCQRGHVDDLSALRLSASRPLIASPSRSLSRREPSDGAAVSESATDEPRGELTVRLIAMPSDTNANGDIFGGWVLSQMDQAGGIAAVEKAQARGHDRHRRHDLHPSGQGRRRAVRLHGRRSRRTDRR